MIEIYWVARRFRYREVVMDSSNQTVTGAQKDAREDQTSRKEPDELTQWCAELRRFLQDLKHANEVVPNDSTKDKLTVKEWLKRLRGNPKAWRLDSVGINHLEQLLTKAGVVS
jgi:hypothetical protein